MQKQLKMIATTIAAAKTAKNLIPILRPKQSKKSKVNCLNQSQKKKVQMIKKK